MRLRAEPGELRKWFSEGVEIGATHLIVFYDPYDHIDERTFVTSDESPWVIWDRLAVNFVVRAIYDLGAHMEEQVAQEPPPFNLPL